MKRERGKKKEHERERDRKIITPNYNEKHKTQIAVKPGLIQENMVWSLHILFKVW